jgi:hypothetical protein
MGSSASKYFEIPKFFVFSKKGRFAGSAEERDFNYKKETLDENMDVIRVCVLNT